MAGFCYDHKIAIKFGAVEYQLFISTTIHEKPQNTPCAYCGSCEKDVYSDELEVHEVQRLSTSSPIYLSSPRARQIIKKLASQDFFTKFSCTDCRRSTYDIENEDIAII